MQFVVTYFCWILQHLIRHFISVRGSVCSFARIIELRAAVDSMICLCKYSNIQQNKTEIAALSASRGQGKLTWQTKITLDDNSTYSMQDYRNWQSTVSAQIERHSWLERQETHFGRTMVNFGEKSAKNTVIFDDFSAKYTIVRGLKIQNFNRTPPFYLRGYGISYYHIITETQFGFCWICRYFAKNIRKVWFKNTCTIIVF